MLEIGVGGPIEGGTEGTGVEMAERRPGTSGVKEIGADSRACGRSRDHTMGIADRTTGVEARTGPMNGTGVIGTRNRGISPGGGIRGVGIRAAIRPPLGQHITQRKVRSERIPGSVVGRTRRKTRIAESARTRNHGAGVNHATGKNPGICSRNLEKESHLSKRLCEPSKVRIREVHWSPPMGRCEAHRLHRR